VKNWCTWLVARQWRHSSSGNFLEISTIVSQSLWARRQVSYSKLLSLELTYYIQVSRKPCSHFQVAEDPNLSCSICRKLDELNGSIKGSLERVVEQRRAYFEELNDCHDPIQRLPVEIVASVFSFCSPRLASLDVFNVGGETIAIHPIQFVLGSVCRYWRLVVCSTPQMWNIIRCLYVL